MYKKVEAMAGHAEVQMKSCIVWQLGHFLVSAFNQAFRWCVTQTRRKELHRCGSSILLERIHLEPLPKPPKVLFRSSLNREKGLLTLHCQVIKQTLGWVDNRQHYCQSWAGRYDQLAYWQPERNGICAQPMDQSPPLYAIDLCMLP